jgi:hypothetical protein
MRTRTHLIARAIEQLECRRLLAAVGPDAFGYKADTHAFEAIDLVPGGANTFTILDAADDASAGINLGTNTFNLYGTNYTGSDQLFVSSNGLISVGSDSNFSNTDLTGDPGERCIAALWDDWINGEVLGKFEGLGDDPAPDRLIVEWNRAHYGNGTPAPDVSFQAILYLNTGAAPGDIVLNFVDLSTGDSSNTNGASATVGIKDDGFQDAGGNRLLISQDNGSNPKVGSSKAILIDAPFATIEGGVVHVGGTESADTITATASGGNLVLNRNGESQSFPLADVTILEIDSFDGNDNIDCAAISVPTNVAAGVGNDHVATGTANDTIFGDTGNDDLFGSDGNDSINGGDGADTIRGWNGTDVIDCGAANDIVYGGDGDDTILGGDGDDTLSGGSQRDRIFGGLGSDRLNGNGGHDRLYGEAGTDRLYGYDHNDWLDGGSSNDRLDGGSGTDTFYGQGGNDRMFADDGGEVDQLFGGRDDDTGDVDASDILASVEITV